MGSTAPKKKRFKGAGQTSFLMRIALLLGGALILLIVTIVIASALAPKSSVPDLIAVAQRQQEIDRVSGNANGQATSQDVANFAANVNVSITSSQQQLIAYLAQHRTTLSSKLLAGDQNPKTDAALTNAASANNYDAVLVQNLTQQLKTYEGLLKITFNQTSNNQTKQLMQACFATASKLLQQAKLLPASAINNS